MFKKLLGPFLGIAVVAIVIFFVISKKKSNDTFIYEQKDFSAYVASFTSGSIASNSTISIIFAQNAVSEEEVGTTNNSLFTFSPSISGTGVWMDERTFMFTPDKRLPSGKKIDAKFRLGDVFEVGEGLNVFEYSFQVITQYYGFRVDNLKPISNTDLTKQQVLGTITTADYAETDNVVKMLKAEQDGKELPVEWNHDAHNLNHSFIVQEVVRKDNPSTVHLYFDGSYIGVDHQDESEVSVLALGDFKVTNVVVHQGSPQYFTVQFSDPLSESQQLEGLIHIDNKSTLDFKIQSNEVNVYPSARQAGNHVLYVERGIKNVNNYKLPSPFQFDVSFSQILPKIRWVSNGNILPSVDHPTISFESVSLHSVVVQVMEIQPSNVMQFLQVNNLRGRNELYRVGKNVFRKRISLLQSGAQEIAVWNRFAIDLSELVKPNLGSLYRVSVFFTKNESAYQCEASQNPDETLSDPFMDDKPSQESSYWDNYEPYQEDDYDWSERDNPCNSAYYSRDKFLQRNLLVSDLGVIVKRGIDQTTMAVVTDLNTVKPVNNATVEVYDFQQRLLQSGTTDADGVVRIITAQNNGTPHFVLAKSNGRFSYLRIPDGEALSVSNFDVGGKLQKSPLKGFLYGERGVWRPGDSLYVSLVLEDKLKKYPENQPVVFELIDPHGMVNSRLVRSTSENGFYSFATATDHEDPTGNWQARVKVGGNMFSMPVKIETVKPNKLKINLDLESDLISASDQTLSGTLAVNWLHGAVGKNLRAELDLAFVKGKISFTKFTDYVFEDPSITFNSTSTNIFDGQVNEEGKADVHYAIPKMDGAPPLLNAVISGKVFEHSGDFSTHRTSIPYYPYQYYTGMKLPKGDQARGMLLTDTTHQARFVTVDKDGNPVSRELEVSLHKLEWSWWWDASSTSIAYQSGNRSRPLAVSKIKTKNGEGSWSFQIKYPDWGRYFIRAVDVESGNSVGKVVYIDWPGWAGRAREDSNGAAMLSFASDKASYIVGENATLVIPGARNARALVSIESGTAVLKTYWVDMQQEDVRFSFQVTDQMVPNVYAHVTMLQPQDQHLNDMPMRLYGVIPLKVENPSTHLEPTITMPSTLEPGQEVEIVIAEKNQRKMSYTVAVVEEGLLDITQFKTPDIWNHFFAREALGVKTWDMFNDVIGNQVGKLERLLAIGGGMDGNSEKGGKKTNRFKPVVKYFGPFTLTGKSNKHSFVMPNYIGSVKTMVVAGYEGAYGTAEQVTPVRKPLMVLATLPRVLGIDNNLRVPITVFSTEASVKKVDVEVKVTGPLRIVSNTKQVVTFDDIGDQLVYFDLVVGSQIGTAQVQVTAVAGKNKSYDKIDIEVINPVTPISEVLTLELKPGESLRRNIASIGAAATATTTLEVSTLPAINLKDRLKYLITYPHGCIEQTTSSVFPQLYLSKLQDIDSETRSRIEGNIKSGIERLKKFMTRDGGFSYWPDGGLADDWGTTYAGHFLLEAKNSGYFIPNQMIERWKSFQQKKSSDWTPSNNQYGERLQAYRLYALALSGAHDLGAMNRFKEVVKESGSKWLLAASYGMAGQNAMAEQLINKVTWQVNPYQELDQSYGSELRDQAMILETMSILKKSDDTFKLYKVLADALNNHKRWMSTQTTAWCLKAAATFAANNKKEDIQFQYVWNNEKKKVATELPIAQIELKTKEQNVLELISNNSGSLFVNIISSGIPPRGYITDDRKGLMMDVAYLDMQGAPIDVYALEQGTEFVAYVSIQNSGYQREYKNISLTQVFPSGWEINNLRLTNDDAMSPQNQPTYQDIRDDRVLTYFDLKNNETKKFHVKLTATYEGEYYMPAVVAEAMYDASIYARKKGRMVKVVKP